MSPRPAARGEPHRRRPASGTAPEAAGVRLERGQRRALYAALVLLAVSGTLWLLFHYFVRAATPFGEGPHPLESWWLRLHGLAAMLTLVALGSLLVTHVGRAWRAGRNRASGSALAAVLALLIATGYALYYFGGEQSRPAISLVHWAFGAVAVVLVAAHVALGRGVSAGRRRQATPAQPARRPAAPSLDEGRLHGERSARGQEPVPVPAALTPGGGDR